MGFSGILVLFLKCRTLREQRSKYVGFLVFGWGMVWWVWFAFAENWGRRWVAHSFELSSVWLKREGRVWELWKTELRDLKAREGLGVLEKMGPKWNLKITGRAILGDERKRKIWLTDLKLTSYNWNSKPVYTSDHVTVCEPARAICHIYK